MDRQPIVLHVPQSKTKTSNLIQYLFFLFRKKKTLYNPLQCIMKILSAFSSCMKRLDGHQCHQEYISIPVF